MEETRNELLARVHQLEIENQELCEKIKNLELVIASLAPYEKDSYDYETEIEELKTTIRVLSRMLQ